MMHRTRVASIDPTRQDVRLADSTRVEFFSDGVFAIVITLLAVEIHQPEVPPGMLGAALRHGWAGYLAFCLGFLYVGVIWLNHHALFQWVERVDRPFSWINLGVLGTTALLPFSTGVLANSLQSDSASDQRAAVVLYAVVAAMMSAAWLPVFPYLHRHPELIDPAAPVGLFASQVRRPVTGVLCYLAAAIAGVFIAPLAAVVLFVVMIGYHAWTSEGIH